MESAPAVPRGAVHGLLRQLVQSCFVLTDRDGAVTRWSGPAHAFFGWDPHAMLGRPLLQTLGVAASPPEHGGRITSPVRLRGGRSVEAELVFIPVRMNHSLEFNGFLSALEQMSVDALSVERLRSGHYGVVDWIEASMVGEGKLAEDEQTAGTIVTFRALDGSHEQYVSDLPPDDFEDFEPLPDEPDTSAFDEARDEAAAARQEAAAAAARVAELEAEGEQLRSELQETRALVEGLADSDLRARLEQTQTLVEALREQVEQAPEPSALVEQLRDELSAADELAQTRAAVDELRERVEQASAGREAIAELRERVEPTATAVEELRTELSALRANVGDGSGPDAEAVQSLISEVEGRLGKVEEAAARSGAHAETARALTERAERSATDAQGHADLVREAGTSIEQHAVRAEQAAAQAEQMATRTEQAGDAVDARVAELQELAAAATRRAETAEEALQTANEALEQTAARAEQAAEAAEQHLVEARIAAEQAGLEADMARVEAERGASRRSGDAAAARRPRREGPEEADPRAPLFGRKTDSGPDRELRDGFDDVDQPLATIALDGHFDALNKPFSELVGYSEQDFKQASWPPVMDRQNLSKHREQMQALLAGELTEAPVNTGYVHAQGLLVPIVGTLSLVRADGEPDHFLLAVERP